MKVIILCLPLFILIYSFVNYNSLPINPGFPVLDIFTANKCCYDNETAMQDTIQNCGRISFLFGIPLILYFFIKS